MNLYKKEMYKKSLQHGVPWRKHKYIRKEGDRYIYPEDLAKGNKSNTTTWDNANIKTWDNSVKPINVKPITVTSGPSKSDLIKQLNKKNAKKRAQNAAIANGQNQAKQIENQKRTQEKNAKKANINNMAETAKYAIDKNWVARNLNTFDRVVDAKRSTKERAKENRSKKFANDDLFNKAYQNRVDKASRAKKEEAQIRSAHQGDTSRVNIESYKENDRDFDDKNYEKGKRIGGTDFVYNKRPDGKYVILEEDSKWVLNKEPDANMTKRLKAFDKYCADMRKAGFNYSADQWEKWATQAINGVDFSKRKVQRKNLKVDQDVYNYNAQEDAERQKKSAHRSYK